MNRRLAGDQSINAPVRDDGEAGEWQDRLVDQSPSPEAMLVEQDESDYQRKALTAAIDVLDDRERRIFQARHLVDEPLTLEDLAAKFNVSVQPLPRKCTRIRESTEGRQEPGRKGVGGDAASLVRCKLPACARKTSGREPAPVLVRSEPRQAPRAPRPRSWLSSGFKCPVDCPPYQLAITPRLASKVIGDRSAPQKSCVYRPPPGCRCICDMVRCISGLMPLAVWTNRRNTSRAGDARSRTGVDL